jgi:hypothetical protein
VRPRLLRRAAIAALVLLALPPPPTAPVVGASLGTACAAAAGVVAACGLAGAFPSPAALAAMPSAFVRKLGRVAAHAAFEEVIWRWAVLGLAAFVLPSWVAVALTTLLFALAHIPAVGWPAAGQHAVTGALFVGALVLSGSLLAAIAAHAAYNGTLLLGRESDVLRAAPVAA